MIKYFKKGELITITIIILAFILCCFISYNGSYKTTEINIDGYNLKVLAKDYTVEATAYYEGSITSTGTTPTPYHTLAVDPKVIPYGSKVYIPEFNKIFIAEDCGSAIKGKKVDIYLPTKDDCLKFGRKNLKIFILK